MDMDVTTYGIIALVSFLIGTPIAFLIFYYVLMSAIKNGLIEVAKLLNILPNKDVPAEQKSTLEWLKHYQEQKKR